MDDLIRAGIAVGVIWQDGRPFCRPDTIRMNLALPHSLVQEAMRRLDQYVFSLPQDCESAKRGAIRNNRNS